MERSLVEYSDILGETSIAFCRLKLELVGGDSDSRDKPNIRKFPAVSTASSTVPWVVSQAAASHPSPTNTMSKSLTKEAISHERTCCGVIEEATYQAREKKANRTKAQPWIVLKLMVGFTLGLMGYTAYVYIGRLCVSMIRGHEGTGGSKGTGSASTPILNAYFVRSYNPFPSFITNLFIIFTDGSTSSCSSRGICDSIPLDDVGISQG